MEVFKEFNIVKNQIPIFINGQFAPDIFDVE